MSFFRELNRRNVIRVGIAYAVVGWVIAQVAEFAFENFGAPPWVLRSVVVILLLGLPMALVFAWAYELTPEGLKREKDVDRDESITPQTGRKLDRMIIAVLAIAVVVLVAERFVFTGPDEVAEPAGVAEQPASIVPETKKSIAVLPFLALSSGPDDEFFADGLTEEILNSLAQLPELLVTARTSAFHFKGRDLPIPEIAEALGVANVVEGSVRRSGNRLRVTAQLIRASDGFHLWSENYDSDSDDAIEVQEDIAEKIAAAMDVVMDEDKRDAMRRVGIRDVEAFIALQKGRKLFDEAHGLQNIYEGLSQANEQFDRVIERVPTSSIAHQLHADLYAHTLINISSFMVESDDPGAELDHAMARMTADMDAAVEHASSAEERVNLEIDRAFLTGNWQGLSSRIDRFVAQTGCVETQWIDKIAFPFGYAASMAGRMNEIRRCDPMLSLSWLIEGRAHLWAGDIDKALAIAKAGSETAPGSWLHGFIIRAQIAAGQFEQAESNIDDRLGTERDIIMHRVMLAAAKGDEAALPALIESGVETAGEGSFYDFLYKAWSGDRTSANRIAARIDANVFGPSSLINVIGWCMCGAPWDLFATPNFAAQLEESGLQWPPLEPIEFPLKSW